MKKRVSSHKLTGFLFACFLAFVSVANLFTKHESVSWNENRTLAEKPKLTLTSLASGSFDDQFENWFSDHFFHRDRWIELHALLRKMSGAIENNGVYFAAHDRLVSQFQTVDSANLQANIDIIRTFCQTQEIKADIFLIPGAAWGAASDLPRGAADINQTQLLKSIGNQLSDQNFINFTELSAPSASLYFKTDHHWNEKGAYQGYVSIASQVLKKVPERFIYTKKSSDFQGTMCSRSGAFWVSKDSIYEIQPETGKTDVQVTYDTDPTIHDSLYAPDRLSEKDQYMYYLDGNHAYVHIKTTAATDKKAIIVKDSYAHILMPFLAVEYSDIQLVDLRYYHAPVSDLLAKADKSHTDFYVLYSLDQFCTDPNLAFLR